MKKILIILLAILAISTQVFAKVPAKLMSSHKAGISSMLKRTMPGVVNIVTRGDIPWLKDPFLRRELMRSPKFAEVLKHNHFASIGSGVIVNAKQGLIITNAHVVDMAKSITVTLNDGRHYQAKKLGADNDSDIAILKINTKNLTAIPLGNSNTIKVGDFVAAIGSPFGLNQTVTSGIVSAVHRGDLGIEGLENFIQTDAPINVGNSGGALVNMKGQLIGMNTAMLSTTGGNLGIGFAIPSNMVTSVVQQILKFGKVRRGLMGILVQTLTPDLAKSFRAHQTKGAIVTQVIAHSPAQKAGLRVGDIITIINGHVVNTNVDVHSLIGTLRAGSKINLTILRYGKLRKITVSTANLKETELTNRLSNPYLYGTNMQEVTEQNSLYGTVSGIKILKLKTYSPAAIAGLIPGDIIISANHQPVHSLKQLLLIAKPNKNGLLLNILRGNGAAFVVIK